jgi:peptidoglycan/LPS O-acetylase OafA/YrhL
MAVCAAAVIGAALIGHAASPDIRHWIVYVFPLARLPEFVLGILLALEVRAGGLRRVRLAPALVLAVVAWVVTPAAAPAFRVAAVTLVPFTMVIAAAAHADLSGQESRLRCRPLVLLGEWSFAFYLLHELVLRTAARALDLQGLSPPAAALAVAATLVTAVAASAALFAFVERPLERRLRSSPGRVAAPWR